ncbi:MAG TPA: hypothetical protein VFK37_01395 [Bacillales bacterium]|nr:hypothetical protein [Bacillales bacterium]
MAYKEEPINMEQAWQSFSEKAKQRNRHPLWEDEEWAGGELLEAKSVEGPSNIQQKAGSIIEDLNRQVPKKKASRWISAAAAALLAGFLLFGPWGGNIMADMLKTFTVQSLQGVHVSQNEVADIENAMRKATPDGKTLHIQDFGQITKFGGGETTQMSFKTAATKMGGNVLSFPGMTPETEVMYEPGMRIQLKLNVEKVNQLLKNLGGTNTLPVSLDGQTIQFVLPPVITMNQPGNHQVSLSEASVPQLNVPNDANLERVKNAVLGLPIIPDDIRQRIEGTTDWRKTLYVPLTNQADHETTVAGHQAIIYHGEDGANRKERALIWLANGHIFMLNGPGSVFSTDQSLIKKAKEIINHGAYHSNE